MSKQNSTILMTLQEQNDTHVAHAGPPTQTHIGFGITQQGRSETSKQGRRIADQGPLAEIQDRRRGVLHFRRLREATIIHRRREELHCKNDRDAEFLEKEQPVHDLRLNTGKTTLRQHKQVCHLATGSKHKTRHRRRIPCFGLRIKVGLQSSRMSAKIRSRDGSLQIQLGCT